MDYLLITQLLIEGHTTLLYSQAKIMMDLSHIQMTY